MDGPSGVRKGAWTREEDILLTNCIQKYGEGRWHQVPQRSGLNRCRKSCRLRWLNYLRPDIKRGEFAADEVDLIIRLHKLLGNRWSLIAGRLPGRTSNDVKNYWNTHLSKNYSPRRQAADQEKSVLVKVTVIKPRPRSFTNNNLNLSSLRKDQDQDVQPADHGTLISKPPPPPFSEDELSWLNSLFSDEKEEEQHKESSTSTCMVLGDGSAGKEYSSISSSLEEVNNIPPVVVGVETLMFNIDQENNESDSWSHQYLSSFHMDLWDL